FVYMVSAGIYFLIKEERAFESYLITLWTGFFLSMLFISIFPTGQELRPESFTRENPAIWAVKQIYAFDTNTNVFPSMHVVGALTVGVSVFKSRSLKKNCWVQAVSAISCVLIVLATVFLKQHSILDVFGGIVFYIAAHFIALGIIKMLDKTARTDKKINT
ncbi:MAG: phosphatase PAP2 family protein, partial [Clostridiales bacterium]|nr:phosphatase PAP2 family protein [Clostridiales bacterium]